jgi:exosortase
MIEWARSRAGLLTALAGSSLLAFHEVLRTAPYRAAREGVEAAEFFEPASNSPLLIVAGALWMITHRRYRLAAVLPARAAALPAALGLAGSAALLLWSSYAGAPDLALPALSLAILGGGALLGGWRAVRLLLVPAFFLLLAFPPPGVLINQLIHPMQLMAGQLTGAYLGLGGVDASVSTELIFTPGQVFHVIETCAGLRSVETLLMAAFLYTELYPSAPPQRTLLLLSAPVVGLLLNGLRIVSIILMPVETSHTLQGIAMLVVGILCIAGLDRLLGRVWPSRIEHPAHQPVTLPLRRTLALSLGLAVVGLASWLIPPWEPDPEDSPNLRRMPSRYGSWRGRVESLDRDYMGSVQPWESVRYGLRREDAIVKLFVGLDELLDRRRSVISEKTLFLEPGVQVLAREQERDAAGRLVGSALWRSPQDGHYYLGRRWYDGRLGPAAEAWRALLALDRGPLRRRDGIFVVSMAADLGEVPPSRETLALAEQALDEVGTAADEAIALSRARALRAREKAAQRAGGGTSQH